MSPTYISAAVLILVNLFTFMGIDIGSQELTSTATTLITIVTGLVIAYRRFQKGDINAAGVKK